MSENTVTYTIQKAFISSVGGRKVIGGTRPATRSLEGKPRRDPLRRTTPSTGFYPVWQVDTSGKQALTQHAAENIISTTQGVWNCEGCRKCGSPSKTTVNLNGKSFTVSTARGRCLEGRLNITTARELWDKKPCSKITRLQFREGTLVSWSVGGAETVTSQSSSGE